jgi:manganese/iron transport system permease protein
MISALLSPFEFQFMLNAFIIVLIISVPTSLFSCYLVLKGWALMGDAISHAVLPGIVVAYVVGVPLLIGAFLAGMICAFATGFLSQNSRVKEDTVMGVVFSGMFGLGIVLYTKIHTDIHLDHILFGNMLGISSYDILITGSIAIGVAVIILVKRSDFLIHSFDPIQTQVLGLNVRLLHYGLLTMLSLTIVSTLSSVGIILSIGLLIAPGAIAFLLTKQFKKMLVIAMITTLLSSFIGVYASFFIDSAPAPTIILVLSIIFICAFILSQLKTHLRLNSIK